MIDDMTNWRIIYYLMSYLIACSIGYFGMVRYYKKNKKREGICTTLYILVAISTIVVIVSSPSITAIQVIIWGIMWGTSGWIAIVAYHIHKKLLKAKDEG